MSKIIDYNLFNSVDESCLTCIRELANKYDMANGFIALDYDDVNTIAKNSSSIKTIEYEISGEKIHPYDFKFLLDENYIKAPKSLLIYFYGKPQLVNIESVVEITNYLTEIVKAPNIIWGAGIDNNDNYKARIAIICGI